MIRAWRIAALLLAPTLVFAAPSPYTAQYDVLRNGDRLGTTTVALKALPNGRCEFTSSTVGSDGLAAIIGVSIDERSILRWIGQQPETVAYTFKQKMAWKTRERSIQVDAGNSRIDSQDKDQHFSPPYRPGVLDRNAVTVAVMHDVAAGKTGELQYLVPVHDELETHVYRTASPERIETALGAQRVVRVERVRATGNGRITTLWLGQDKNFVPLRMLQKEPNGDTIEMRIVSIR